MRRLTRWPAVLALIAAVAGCGHSHSSGRVLRLETANPAGVEHDPGVPRFVARVAQLSHGRLRIAVDDGRGRGGVADEGSLIRDVARGFADLGVAHTRTFDSTYGDRQLGALDAPMLVDRHSLEDALLAAPLARRLLASTRKAGVFGLALLAGPLTYLVGTRGLPARVGDFHTRLFLVRGDIPSARVWQMPVAQLGARALRPYTYLLSGESLTHAYIVGPRQIEAPGYYEDDLDSLFFDRYSAQCAPPNQACRGMGPSLALNVAIAPRTSVLVASPALLSKLSPRERSWLHAAAASATAASKATADADQRLLDDLCAAGVRAAVAPRRLIAGMRRRWAELYLRLPAQPEIRAIERLRRATRPDPPLRIPAGCVGAAPHRGPARGTRSTLPDGVYRVRITPADLRASGATGTGDRPGVATLTLRGGRWRLVMTEHGEHVESGTYAGAPVRTAWQLRGPAGRDEAYMSIAVERDGALRFDVARADDLPHAEALYGSHPWRRIGP